MWGFGKKRRQEKLIEDALAVSKQFSLTFNNALEHWRATSIESRRAMFDARFAESVAILAPTDRLCFETRVEIEALALMSVWIERVGEYKVEFPQFESVAALEMEKELEGLLDFHIAEVTKKLESDFEFTITEAIHRRGETTTRTNARKISERCLTDEPFLDSLNSQEILDHLHEMVAGNPTFNKLLDVMRRLYDVAYSDHGVSIEDRDLASSAAEAVKSSLEETRRDDPKGLKTLHSAVDTHKEWARKYGFGTLYWIMNDQGILPSDMFDFVTKKEHSVLLPAFLELLVSPFAPKTRNAIVIAMLNNRGMAGQSAIEVLNELVKEKDKSLTLLLNRSELQILNEAEVHPGTAEKLVAALLGRES